MRLGSRLFHARKKSGLSQENVADKLGVSRQTISKWETDEILPDILQSKKLAFYHKTVHLGDYAPILQEMLTQLQIDYGYNHTDALLVLKDLLARVWKG